MISVKIRGLVNGTTRVFEVLLAIVLLGNAPLPVLAQSSGTWTNTGTLNIPRNGHTGSSSMASLSSLRACPIPIKKTNGGAVVSR